MNHDEATRLMASEKYLLGELTPELREQFEEHFFECPECAVDLRAANAFIAHSRAVLAGGLHSKAAPARSSTQPSSWLGWLRPGIVVPAFAILLAVIGYQNLVTYPKLKQMIAAGTVPRVIATASLLSSNTRGSNLPSVSAGPDQPFLLFVDIPPEPRFPSYVAELLSPAEDLSGR